MYCKSNDKMIMTDKKIEYLFTTLAQNTRWLLLALPSHSILERAYV